MADRTKLEARGRRRHRLGRQRGADQPGAGGAGLKVVCLDQGGWTMPEDHPHFAADWEWQRQNRGARSQHSPCFERRLSCREHDSRTR